MHYKSTREVNGKYVFVRDRVRVRVYMYIRIYIHVYTCTCVGVRACIRTYVHIEFSSGITCASTSACVRLHPLAWVRVR